METINVPQLTKTQAGIIRRLHAQGITHAKGELEAQLNRDEYGDDACEDCNEGYAECYHCDGSGVVEATTESPSGRELSLTEVCASCDGDGEHVCNSCDGNWESSGDGWDEDRCQDFILENVSEAARAHLTYGEFYNDGSVDSEYTYTMPIEYMFTLMPEYVRAFKLLAEEIGNGLDTSGAGMHLSFLTDGDYPRGQKALNPEYAANFKREASKLMLSAYFLASPDHKSRSLHYRSPIVSTDKHSYSSGHYSGICTHGDTCFEFRIFETCYDKPEAMADDFEVMANMLKYYSARKVSTEVPKGVTLEDNYTNNLARFYQTPEALANLNATLPLIKPKNAKISDLKRARGFAVTLKELRLKAKIHGAEREAEYKAYLAGREESLASYTRWVAERHLEVRAQYATYTEADCNLGVRSMRCYEADTPELQAAEAERLTGRLLSFDEWYSGQSESRSRVSYQLAAAN